MLFRLFVIQVCVQGSMGEGALAGMPLQLAGTRKILEFMDWGDYGAKDTFIKIGSIGKYVYYKPLIFLWSTFYIPFSVEDFDTLNDLMFHISFFIQF